MAKKQLDEDLLTGGSLNTEKDKQAKKPKSWQRKNPRQKKKMKRSAQQLKKK